MTSESALARIVPVAAVLAALLLVWYAAALPMNSGLPSFPAGGTLTERLVAAWSLERPVLPAPHQIVAALWATTVDMPVSSPRSLVFHGWVTLSSTLLGFALGAVLGMALAVGIVHVRTLERSLMPWLIASQTIPILAIAPIVVMPIATGKNERYIEISAFGTSPVMPTAPSATTTIGAMARIGIVCEAISHGIRLRSRVRT